MMQQNPTPDHLLVPLSIATIAIPMAQPSLPETPQEIIDEIIDLCSGEKATLIAYSLTSKSWGSRTRKYLFSKLTLTDKTLPVWCKTVAIPIPSTDATPQLLADPHPPVSSALSSYVTSLKITTAYSYPETGLMGEPELLQAKLHLSAFTNVKSLILGPISFITFKYASLETCLGSLAATVRELKLSFCFLDEDSIFAILRVFSHLESLELDGNLWVHNPPLTSQNGPPTLRGSFTASGFLKESQGLLDLLATARVEYHTFTIGNNHRSTLSNFNTLLEKCGDHLKTLILTAPELGPLYGSQSFKASSHLSQIRLTTSSRRQSRLEFEPLPLQGISRNPRAIPPRPVRSTHFNTQYRPISSVPEVIVLHYCGQATRVGVFGRRYCCSNEAGLRERLER